MKPALTLRLESDPIESGRFSSRLAKDVPKIMPFRSLFGCQFVTTRIGKPAIILPSEPVEWAPKRLDLFNP
jgi:hypothetical protein